MELIIAALLAGGSAGLTSTASQAVGDAYSELKRLIRVRFKRDRQAQACLDGFPDDPAAARPILLDALARHQIAADPGIREAAERVLQLIRDQGNHISIGGNVYGLAQGDGQDVFMHFGPHGGGDD